MTEQLQPPDDRPIEKARGLIEPYFPRLLGEVAAMRDRRHEVSDLVVEVPGSWPKEFDDGATVLGMGVVRADVAEPRIAVARPAGLLTIEPDGRISIRRESLE